MTKSTTVNIICVKGRSAVFNTNFSGFKTGSNSLNTRPKKPSKPFPPSAPSAVVPIIAFTLSKILKDSSFIFNSGILNSGSLSSGSLNFIGSPALNIFPSESAKETLGNFGILNFSGLSALIIFPAKVAKEILGS